MLVKKDLYIQFVKKSANQWLLVSRWKWRGMIKIIARLHSSIIFLPLLTDKPWCSRFHFCTTPINKVYTQVLRRFKSCSRRVIDWWWWESVTLIQTGNKANHLSSINHFAKTIHHHHYYHYHHHQTSSLYRIFLNIHKIQIFSATRSVSYMFWTLNPISTTPFKGSTFISGVLSNVFA